MTLYLTRGFTLSPFCRTWKITSLSPELADSNKRGVTNSCCRLETRGRTRTVRGRGNTINHTHSPLVSALQHSSDLVEVVAPGDIESWLHSCQSEMIGISKDGLHTLNMTTVHSIVQGQPTNAILEGGVGVGSGNKRVISQ